jgi:uncharacterized protein YlzI (FlbEa/FlbD family)
MDNIHQYSCNNPIVLYFTITINQKNITEAGTPPETPTPETTVILSKGKQIIFKTSSHGLFESNSYCIDSITTEHVD